MTKLCDWFGKRVGEGGKEERMMNAIEITHLGNVVNQGHHTVL